MRKLVLLGGGHSQIEVLRQFAMHPVDDVAITLVTRELMAPYSGMLPGFIAGHYTHGEAHIDLRSLAEAAGARVVFAEACKVDAEKKAVLFDDRPALDYDLLSINIGSRPVMTDIPGARDYALPSKPVDQLIEGWERIQQDALASNDPYTITIVGAGAGGVELALTMQYHLKTTHTQSTDTPFNVRINVVTDDDKILPTHNEGVRTRIMRLMHERDIQIHLLQRVTEVVEGSIATQEADRFDFDALIWVTNAAAPFWLRESAIQTNDEGFILIDQTLRSTSHREIFATGDIATLENFSRSKSGVFAVRQGPYLAKNIRHALTGESLEEYVPQEKFLSLIGTGNKSAIASKGNFSAQGPHIWAWKDYIDRKFMNMYGMVTMNSGDSQDDMAMSPMHCAGCGSKVGARVLSQSLSRLREAHPEAGERISYGDDAALVAYPQGKQVAITVDHFKSFIDDPYLLGKITATHCLSDIYAMGGRPHNVLASVTLPHALEDHYGDVLYELLEGTFATLEADGAALVGGHTAQGEDFFYGLTVNGVMDDAPIEKHGACTGDVIILTKAIGTGTVLAGDMRRLTQNTWLLGAIDSMTASNREATAIFREHHATALTDITGFGLAGHLLEMLGDQTTAEVALEDVPLLPGALRLSRDAIRSTLFPENVRVEDQITNAADFQKFDCYPLLFDPQTSGGLLATVPEHNARACVEALQETTGQCATIIGHITNDSSAPGTITLS
ncbi:MAG: selenide, water dikinase SelD [Candidatus Hydrogenedentota bacterium]